MKTVLPILFLAFSLNLNAQKVDKASVNYKTYLIPSVPVADVNTVGFKIYSVYDGLNKNNLKVKKLEYAQEKTNEKARFFLNELTAQPGEGDLSIEVAFGQITFGEKTLKTYKAPCVRDDGNLTKDDIKECDAYAYVIPYQLPAAYQIKDKNGKVVYAEILDADGSYTWGESDLNPHLKKTELEAAYTKTDPFPGITSKVHSAQIENFFETIDDVLYFEKYKHSFTFGAGKGKAYDYTEQVSMRDKAVAVFDADKPDFAQLNACIEHWKKELETADTGNKDARVNRKVARELNSNLAIAYMYQNNFVEATKYARAHAKLSSTGNHLAEVKRRYIAYKINGDVTIPEKMVKAKDFKLLVSQVKDGEFFATEDRSAEIIKNAQEFKAQFEQEIEEDSKEITEAGTAGENPYRSMISSTPTQGNMLMLNAFTNGNLVGQAMPAEIADLKELNHFRAYNMKMTSVPETIGNLVNLESLDLAGNAITSLPPSIGQLKNLKNLNLTNNPIDKLPDEIKQCTNLKTIKLKGTKVSAEQIADIQAALPKCKIK